MATEIVVQVRSKYRSVARPDLWFQITATDGTSYFCKWQGENIYGRIAASSLVKLTQLEELLLHEHAFYKAEVLDGRT